jgi:hypothetical protein
MRTPILITKDRRFEMRFCADGVTLMFRWCWNVDANTEEPIPQVFAEPVPDEIRYTLVGQTGGFTAVVLEERDEFGGEWKATNLDIHPNFTLAMLAAESHFDEMMGIENPPSK